MSTLVKRLINDFEGKMIPIAPSLSLAASTAGAADVETPIVSVEVIKAKLLAGTKKLWLQSPLLGENGRGVALEKLEKIAACSEMTKTLAGFTYSSFYCRATLEHAILSSNALGECFIVACPEAPANEFLQTMERYENDLVVFRV